jgi:NitT/TauT family transport system permease protein
LSSAARAVDDSTTVAVSRRRGFRLTSSYRLNTVLIQITILVSFMLLWEYLPRVEWARSQATFLDPFFISSPTRVAQKLGDLATGANESTTVWPYARLTVQAAILGTIIGTFIGAGLGLLLSNSRRLSDVLKPFIVALNAVPRIALIPIIVIVFGPTLTSSIVVSTTVVVFVVFFSAYTGGLSVSPHVIQNAQLLGASSSQIMLGVRLPYVFAWTVAVLPNAVSFSLVSVVTAEILTGSIGMGRLLLSSVTTVEATLTIACAVVLSIVGVILVGLTEIIRRKLLHWWARD